MERLINHREIAVALKDEIQYVPILNISVMSPEKERELVKRQKQSHPDWYTDYYERKVQTHEN